MNNIVDIASWPTQDIEDWVKDNRPIGLGIMGFADACLLLGMKYGDEDSIDFARQLVYSMYDVAEDVSIDLGNERGVPLACKHLPTPRRNVTLLSIAPTGTISLIAGCSSGCEPVFQFVQVRQDNTGSYIIINPAIKAQLHIEDKVYPKGHDLAALQLEAKEIYDRAKSVMSSIMVSADEVSIDDHIKIQAAFQNGYGDNCCVDSGVSKTINMPNSATVEDVKRAYELAYSLKCKGITIYRDGSKHFQILNKVETAVPATKEAEVTNSSPSEWRTKQEDNNYDIVPARRFKMTYKGNRWYVIVGESSDGKPMEIFLSTNVQDDTIPMTEALARMISLGLRFGVPYRKVISQLQKVRGYAMGTFPAMIVRALQYYDKSENDNTELTCAECGSTNIELVGGCGVCKDCGYSKCG